MGFHLRHRGSAAAQRREREAAAAYADSRRLRFEKTGLRFLNDLDAARGDITKVSLSLGAFRDAAEALKDLNQKALGAAT
jgi:hypothetical protein